MSTELPGSWKRCQVIDNPPSRSESDKGRGVFKIESSMVSLQEFQVGWEKDKAKGTGRILVMKPLESVNIFLKKYKKTFLQ